MNRVLWRNTIISFTTHILLICVLLGYSLVSCRSRRAPRELIVFADFQPGPAQPPAPAPTPTPIEEPAPTPVPPAPKPSPTLKKQKIEVNTNLVRRIATARAQPKPQSRPLSAEEIRRKLDSSVAHPVSSGAAGMGAGSAEATPYGWYLNQVRVIMYEAWEQPSASATRQGAIAQVMLRVRQDGLIMQRNLLKSSGSAVMDRSVMAAVEKVERLPELPFGFGGAHKDITVDFELEPSAP